MTLPSNVFLIDLNTRQGVFPLPTATKGKRKLSPSTRAETPLTRLDLQTCSCHCASTRTSSSSRGCGSTFAPATPARAPSVRFCDRAPKPLLPPFGVECLQRLLIVLSSRGPIAPLRRKKRPRKIKCSYACLRIRWHGSRAVQLCVRWCTSSA